MSGSRQRTTSLADASKINQSSSGASLKSTGNNMHSVVCKIIQWMLKYIILSVYSLSKRIYKTVYCKTVSAY